MGRPIVIEDPSAASDSQRPTAFAVEGMPRRNSLVTLQEGDDELAPLFLVHDADGEVFVYNNLAWRMGNRRSVYAFRPCGRSDAPLLQTRIEDMAATYVREIRQVRPHGPYLLGGLCAGGVLAFEMALQLEAANEEARLIALLDTTDVEARAKPLRQASRRIRRFRKAVGAASVRQLPEAVATKVFGYLNYEAHAWLHRAYDAFAVATFTFCENRRLPLPPWARGLPVRTLFAGAESRYRPGNRVREEIVLFRATEGDGSLEPFVAAYADPLFGWGRRSAKGARAIDVPTSHAAMLEEPNVGFIAEALRSYLGDDESVRRG
jgi:thioesterase domain-containing protein